MTQEISDKEPITSDEKNLSKPVVEQFRKTVTEDKCKSILADLRTLGITPTYASIGKHLGVSKQRAHQIFSEHEEVIKKARDEIKHQLKSPTYEAIRNVVSHLMNKGDVISKNDIISELASQYEIRFSAEWLIEQLEFLNLNQSLKLHNSKVRLEALANHCNAKGGELLSSDYRGVVTKYLFRCGEGHEWTATFQNVVKRNSWCPCCWDKRFELIKKQKKGKEFISSF